MFKIEKIDGRVTKVIVHSKYDGNDGDLKRYIDQVVSGYVKGYNKEVKKGYRITEEELEIEYRGIDYMYSYRKGYDENYVKKTKEGDELFVEKIIEKDRDVHNIYVIETIKVGGEYLLSKEGYKEIDGEEIDEVTMIVWCLIPLRQLGDSEYIKEVYKKNTLKSGLTLNIDIKKLTGVNTNLQNKREIVSLVDCEGYYNRGASYISVVIENGLGGDSLRYKMGIKEKAVHVTIIGAMIYGILLWYGNHMV